MSNQTVLQLDSPLFARVTSRAPGRLEYAGLTLNGLYLFVIGALVVGSGYQSLRPDIAGLALHPYLIPVALALPPVLMMRLHLIPVRVMAAAGVFTGMYFFSVFNGAELAAGEIVKISGGLATILVCALMIRRRGDFVAGALGLCLAVCMLAARGFQTETGGGVEAVEGANRNSYSLFALPAVLLAGYIMLNFKTVPLVIKGIFLALLVPSLAAIFFSANRSGYLGALVVALMLFWSRRGKGLVLVGLVSVLVIFVVTRFGSSAVFDERMRQTVEGNKSDNLRMAIVMTCVQIGLENPLIGVSPQKIQLEIGRRLSVVFNEQRVIDSHNVFAHIFAASGAICFGALIFLGWTLWNWKPRDGSNVGGKEDPLNAARGFLRMLIVLWVVRGLFTREVLYNPSFNIAMGLAIGLCLLAEVARKQAIESGQLVVSKSPGGAKPAGAASG